MSIEELKALMDAVTMMSPVHYQAYKNYIKITDGEEMRDAILCRDKEDAIRAISDIGMANIEDWEYIEDGKIRIILNCKLEDISTEQVTLDKEKK